MKSFTLTACLLALGLAACAPAHPPMSPLNQQAPLQMQTQTNQPTARFYDTAKDALTWAEFDARFWDTSAELIKVEARDIDRDGRSREWVYYFKSPWKRSVLRVTSQRQKREVSDTFFGDEFDADGNWKIDSKRAIEIARQHGLRSFPVREMTLEDRFDLEWEIRSWDGWYRINAETGAVSKR